MGNSWADWKSKKSFWSFIFSYSMQQQWTISQSNCDLRWKVDFMTVGDNQPSSWIAKMLQSTSQSQTWHQKKVMVTVWWSAAHLIHYNFLNPSETITSVKSAQQTNKMHRKLQCQQLVLVKIKGPLLLFTTMPDCPLHNQHFRNWTNWARKFCLIHHVHLHMTSRLPIAATSSISTTFCRKYFHNQQEAENAFQEFVEPWGMDFYITGTDKHFSLAKMCWL